MNILVNKGDWENYYYDIDSISVIMKKQYFISHKSQNKRFIDFSIMTLGEWP